MTGIVILNYNNTNDTINCIDSIVKYTDMTKVKIIVVDNASKIEVQTAIYEYLNKKFQTILEYNKIELPKISLPKVTYLKITKNIGYACGNNAGVEILYKDSDINYIMILNNDIVFTMDIITKLKEELNKLNDCAVISPLLYKSDGISLDYTCARKEKKLSYFLIRYIFLGRDFFHILDKISTSFFVLKKSPNLLTNKIIPIDFPSGSCLMSKKEIWRNIGGFSSDTFLYFEEDILYEKIKKKSLKCYMNTSVSCIHTGGATTSEVTSLFKAKCEYNSLNIYLKKYRKPNCVYNLAIKLFANLTFFRILVSSKIKTLI